MSAVTTIVKNPSGLHARPAAQLSAFCKKFPNTLRIECGARSANPKSMFNLLNGCFKAGDSVSVQADGEDGENVARQIADFIAALEE